MNPYLDKIMLQEGRDSADRLHQDFADAERLGGWNRPVPASYNFVDPAEAVVGKGADFDQKASRIEQLRGEIASLEKQIKDYDAEEEMGKYKFQYDADPSTYVNVQQSKRNAEATEAIRKTNEKASEQSNMKSLWEGTSLKSEELFWQLKDFEQKFSEAKRENNVYGMEQALEGMKKTQAVLNRTNAERESLRQKLMAGAEPEAVEVPKDGTDYSQYEKGIAGARDVTNMKAKLVKLKKDIKVDNVSIPPRQKALNGKKWLADIDAQQKEIEASPLSDENKAALKGELDDMREAVRNYLKPAGKGGQGESMTSDKFMALSAKDLKALGNKALRNYKNRGFKNRNLDWAINVTAGK